MLKTRPKKTVRDYMALPDEPRVELIQGEFEMVPAPTSRHQLVIGNLHYYLKDHVLRGNLGILLLSPVEVILSDETVLQPDLLFIARYRSSIVRNQVEGAPDLVIEVLSPSTRLRDRFVKRELFTQFGVREYWLVDPDDRTIEVLVQSQEGYKPLSVFEEKDSISTPGFPDLNLDLAKIWA
jgi:Uma2 family endonuclease